MYYFYYKPIQMTTTQRIQIREICCEVSTFGEGIGSILNAREIKRFLCDKNSYLDIKKTLLTAYTTCSGVTQHYAFADVVWRENDDAKKLQSRLLEEDSEQETKIQVSEKVTWFIKSISKHRNLYHGSIFSMTTTYYKSYIDPFTHLLNDTESFYGVNLEELRDDDELPGPLPMYRSMRVEYILDKGNVDLDENI